MIHLGEQARTLGMAFVCNNPRRTISAGCLTVSLPPSLSLFLSLSAGDTILIQKYPRSQGRLVHTLSDRSL